MKLLGALFLLVGVAIMLVAGVAALQGQVNVGDTIITNTSENYDTYTELKNTTTSTMNFAGYSPWLLIIIVFSVLAVMIAGAVYAVTKM